MFLMNIVLGIIAPVLVPERWELVMFAVQAGFELWRRTLDHALWVRLLINQIIPAFQGIAEKSRPCSQTSFDVPIPFNYRPNAVIIGFIVAMITSTILVIIVNTTNVFES